MVFIVDSRRRSSEKTIDLCLEVPTNEAESNSSPPPNFHRHLQLLPHQLKSLSWMQSQENGNVSIQGMWEGGCIVGTTLRWSDGGTTTINIVTPNEFTLTIGDHTVTAVLERDAKLHWSDGDVWIKVASQDHSYAPRGGVLADRIGTGKTCVGLALIDKARCVETSVPSSSRKLASHATLVIVPPNICTQWAREVDKFLQPGTLRVFVAQELTEVKSWSVRDIAVEADIILVSYRIFASKSYGQRRRQLESFSRDDLGEAGMKFPVFELFHFHRIIADEFHELVEAARDKLRHPFSEAMHALCRIQSNHRWGITSTPPLKSVGDVVAMASFFHVTLPPTVEAVTDFVARFVRRNSTETARVSLIQRKVLVAQTVHERALYLLRRRQGAKSQDLLSYASVQWSWSAEHDDRTDSRTAKEICKTKLRDLYRPIMDKEEQMKEAIVKVKLAQEIRSVRQLIGADVECELAKQNGCRKALESVEHFFEDGHLEKELTRNRRAGEKKLQAANVKGTAEQVLSLMKGLAEDYTTVMFFENSLDESDAGIECPVCLNKCCRADCSIAKCGHKACSQCWSAVLKSDPRCPLCREFVGDSLITLSAGTKMKPLKNATTQEGTSFGSKVACLLDTLNEIRTQEPTAKVVVFCQFEELKVKVTAAFKELGVEHLKLEGSTEKRSHTVEQFLSPEGPATLLLSMAISPSGLDLSVANHVILVQPTWHEDSDDKSVDYEAQSIGRCWRMGQDRPVTVHRLCMVDTIEESVVDRHLELWSTNFGALQQ
mmetsp:Transcript_59324/g.94177  ORF Transcript_59324/g.94177 Transcript_59324/m.94177 type:complete len:774 (-) Transcript_59324:135-2456(-)